MSTVMARPSIGGPVLDPRLPLLSIGNLLSPMEDYPSKSFEELLPLVMGDLASASVNIVRSSL